MAEESDYSDSVMDPRLRVILLPVDNGGCRNSYNPCDLPL